MRITRPIATTTCLSIVLLSTLVLSGETAAGIKWTAPRGWKSEGARPMRAATYHIAPVPGDGEEGECGVFYFGQGQGGSVEDNVNRWVGQFEQPGGKPSRQAAQIKNETVSGLRVTTIDVTGTYTGGGGPMAQGEIRKPGYRLLGAIVEAPQGVVFFKFTGPLKSVTANQGAFQAMIRSLARQ